MGAWREVWLQTLLLGAGLAIGTQAFQLPAKSDFGQLRYLAAHLQCDAEH